MELIWLRSDHEGIRFNYALPLCITGKHPASAMGMFRRLGYDSSALMRLSSSRIEVRAGVRSAGR